MSYPVKWCYSDVTKQIAARQVKKYGHLLKWKNYKEVCLEVGCAEGSITKEVVYPWVENRIEKLVAVDKLEDMIKFAKEHNSAEKLDYLAVDIMDNNMTKDMINQYDHIFSTCVDHLIADTRSYVSTLHSLLKPEGQLFVVALPDNFFKRSLVKQFQNEKWLKYKPQRPIFAEYTANPTLYLTNILKRTGFKVNKCEYEKLFFTTEDLEGFSKAVIEMFRHLELITADLLEEFSMDFVEECKKQCTFLDESNKYDIPFDILTLIATAIT